MRILLILLFFCSCYNSKKAAKQIDKANDKYPELVAELARDKYPCTDLLTPDTTVIYKDSLVFVDVECPEVIPAEVVIKTDTVNNIITRTVRVPVHLPIQIRTINKWYEDSAKLKLLTITLNKANTANVKLNEVNVSLSDKVAAKSKENWLWRIIALVLLAILLYRLWFKFIK